jgi:molecular chaperone GrpE
MKKKKRTKSKPAAADARPDALTPEEINLLEDGDEESADEAEGEVMDAPETETQHEKLYRETLDRYQRTLAEFDNFRKRTVKEKAAQYDDGIRAAAEKLLPLADNFERALQAGEENADATFYQGIALIARQFAMVLLDLNVEAMATKPGDAFDPNLHNAVAHVEDDGFGASQIADVLQKGYMYKDRVLRYSMVKVAN